MSSSAYASAKKITRKPSASKGSMLYSLGMSAGTVKKTRKASKSTRSPAVNNSSRIKDKRVRKQNVGRKTRMKKPAGDVIVNANRTQVAGEQMNGASQAREIMQLKQQLAAAEEKLKKKRANEKTLVNMVAELEKENAELLKAHQSKGSDLSDRALSIALGRLTDALTTIEELRADIKIKDEKLKKSEVAEYEGKIEPLGAGEQKSNGNTTAFRKKFFRYTGDRRGQPMRRDYAANDESLEYSDDYDYGDESPVEF